MAEPGRAPDGTPKVATRELTLGQKALKRIDDGSEPMNIDGSTTGAVDVAWNGSGGGGDAGGDWTTSGTGSETTPSAHNGNKGWDTGVAALNDKTTFDNGAEIDVDGTYAVLQFWLQPQAYPVGSKLQVGFLDAGNTRIGEWMNVEDYVENMDLGVWQQVAIPIDDFGLTVNVQKIRFRYRDTAGQHYYIDDIELVQNGGGPYKFRVEAPDANTRYHLTMLVLVLAGPSAGWDLNKFANVTALSKGLLLRQKRLSTKDVLWKFNSKDNTAMFGRYHPQDDIVFADNNMLVGFMVKPGQASIVITDDDVVEFVVRDDLSGITSARAYVHYGVEVI